MKRFTVIAALVAAFISSVLVSRVALADGKMMIYPYRWRQAPPLPQAPVLVVQKRIDDQTERVINDYRILPKPGTVIPRDYEPSQYERSYSDYTKPEYPDDFAVSYPIGNEEEFPVEDKIDYCKTDAEVAYETFSEDEQNAIIAWNGYEDGRGEETLILTTREVSRIGGGAMLSVLPLPGEPIEIQVVNPEIFNRTQKLLFSKILREWDYSPHFDNTPIISPHNIFVLKLDNLDSFKKEVTAYVAMKYNYKAAALIDQNTEKIIKAYFDRGFRYFAFDLTMVSKKSSYKATISYRFKSKSVYFPLQISGIGGTPKSTCVNLIIMTPGMIRLTPSSAVNIGDKDCDAVIIGNKAVVFSMSEVAGIDPELEAVLKNNSIARVREVSFNGKLNGYDGDFTAENLDKKQ